MSRKGDTHRVLAVLTSEWTYGLDLMRAAGLHSGRFFPAIYMLEASGDVEAMWEDMQPGMAERRRRYYRRKVAA